MTTDELSRLVDACLLPAFDGPVPPAWLLERSEASQIAAALGIPALVT